MAHADIEALRLVHEIKDREWKQHQEACLQKREAEERLHEVKREAGVLLRTLAPPAAEVNIKRKSIRGGRVFRFESSSRTQSHADISAISLLPVPMNDDLRIEAPMDDQDGCLTEFFSWLRAKHPMTQEGCPHIMLPDTVVYKYRQPFQWYFTDRTGNVRRKKKESVHNEAIFAAFTSVAGSIKQASGDSVVALYMYACASDHVPAGREYEKSATFRQDRKTIVRHLTARELHNFLFFSEKENDGMLQRFVTPKTGHNSTFVASWSPHALLLEQYVNATKVSNSQSSTAYARTVTFEAEPFSAAMRPVRGVRLPSDVQRSCQSIVDHTAAVSVGRICITRLALTFKMDQKGKLWLSACTSLRYNPSGSFAGHKQSTHESRGDTQDAKVEACSSDVSCSSAARVGTIDGHSASCTLGSDSHPQSPSSVSEKQVKQQRPQSANGTQARQPAGSYRFAQHRRPHSASTVQGRQRARQALTLSQSRSVGTLDSSTPLNLAHRFSPAPSINPRVRDLPPHCLCLDTRLTCLLHAQLHDPLHPSARVELTERCPCCEEMHVKGTGSKLAYRVIVAAHRKGAGSVSSVTSLAGQASRMLEIPQLIANELPGLSADRFWTLVQNRDPGFLARSVKVCLSCYLRHVDEGAPSLQGGPARTPSFALPRRQMSSQHLALSVEREVSLLPGRQGSSKWAERDLLYLVGHERAKDRRRGGEFIVPQVPPFAASTIAEMGVASPGTRRRGLSEAKLLELFDRTDELSTIQTPNDLKNLMEVLRS